MREWVPGCYWSPKTLTSKATELSQQLDRFTAVDMAQKSEVSAVERMMEMMMKMRQEDKKEVM